MIFLSFAAEFSFKRALKHLFAVGTQKHSDALKLTLQSRYHGSSSYLYGNGRTALSEALRHLVPANSSVIINGLTCHAVPQAVKSANCTPIYVDINDQDFNFDIQKLTQVLDNNKTISAIIIQNHLGLATDIVAIEKLAKKHNLVIIEDLAHSAGSHYTDGREMGTIGSATALSFGKGKSIDTTEGGALVLRDEPSSSFLQSAPPLSNRLRNRFYPILGWTIRKTYSIGLGKLIATTAFRLRFITRSAEGKIQPHIRPAHWQSNLALQQIKQLNHTAQKRLKYTSYYKSAPSSSSILRIPLLVNHRDQLLGQLRSQRVYIDDPWYDVPVSPRRYYHRANYPENDCPTAVRVAQQMLNLPLLPKTQLDPIIKIINSEAPNPNEY